MSESILISIQPKWCELIASGKKTLEVRKTRPKLAVPFKVYIYCTSGSGKNTFNVPVSHEQLVRHYAETGSMECLNCPIGNGKVIGEFTCDTFVEDETLGHDALFNGAACMTEAECAAYSTCSPIYGWHISNLKIYEKPKKLNDFTGIKTMRDGFELRVLERPPQSWCYVDVVEDANRNKS